MLALLYFTCDIDVSSNFFPAANVLYAFCLIPGLKYFIFAEAKSICLSKGTHTIR